MGRESWIYQYRIICIFRYGRRKFPVRACLKHDFKPGYTADTQFQREIISYTAKAVVVIFMTAAAFILSKNRKFVFAAVTPHFSFFPRMCGGKTPCKRKNACSTVFFQGHRGGIPVQDGVDFFRHDRIAMSLLFRHKPHQSEPCSHQTKLYFRLYAPLFD